jgi:hypothetical protein
MSNFENLDRKRSNLFFDFLDQQGVQLQNLQFVVGNPNSAAAQGFVNAFKNCKTNFEEPESHKQARDIMGKYFQGVSEAQKFWGNFTPEQLEARRQLSIYDEQGKLVTDDQETVLKILKECKGTHAMQACHPVTLPELQQRFQDRFDDDGEPWFGKKEQRKKWSEYKLTQPWQLIRRTPLPDSWGEGMNVEGQQNLLQTAHLKESNWQPVQCGYGALLNQDSTGEKLCEDKVIRFNVQTADGYWVNFRWLDAQLSFRSWRDNANSLVGSARTSA